MSLAAFATLSRLGPVVRTDEAAAALGVSLSQASHTLGRLQALGHARRLRRGLWIVGPAAVDPLALAEEITRPYPAYVSFLSALNAQGVIDQLPREIGVASLQSARRVRTPLATYAIHHLPPALFGGWTERDGVKLASPGKALFDLAYVAAAHRGGVRQVPELDLARDFDRAELDRWLRRIASDRVRTLTARSIRRALAKRAR